MMQKLKKFDKFVAIERDVTKKQARIYNSRIGVMKEWKKREMQLYLYKDGRLMNVSIENPDNKKIEETIKKAENIMKHLPETSFELGKNGNYINKKYFDKNVLNDEKIIDKVEKAINYADAEEVAGILYSQVEKIRLLSPFIEIEDNNSMSYLSIRIFNGVSSHAISCSRKIEGIKEKVVMEAKEMVKMARKEKNVKEGRYDVLFAPLAFSNLIYYFGIFSSAFSVDAGYSFLANKIGKKIASDKLSIYDSGIEKDGLFSIKFDEEGVATRKTVIVENGVLKNYLHNSTTAARYKTQTTGNAGIISPHPWNIMVKAGEYNLEEILHEMKEGLLITNVWYTRFHNYRNGDFSTISRDVAFYIKNGEIQYTVKGARISDNLERILKNIVALSKERKQIYWWEVENPVFAPYALAKDIRITTSF